MDINFFKIEDAQLIAYNYYEAQVSNNDLLELNSYKIRNILSLVFNPKTRDLILEEIFHEGGAFLTSETQHGLHKYLSSDERDELKNHLYEYLNYQIDSQWQNTITQVLKIESINIIVIPTLILHHDSILAQLKTLFPHKKFIDWYNYKEPSRVLFLDYNHAWKKQNLFTVQDSNSLACFIKHFFENTYQWKKYDNERSIFKSLVTPLRELLFSTEILEEIKSNLNELKPKEVKNIWSNLLEDQHKSTYNYAVKEEIRVHFNKTKANDYPINSLFILLKENKYTIKNAAELIENAIQYEEGYEISNLENIIINIDADKITEAIEKDSSVYEVIQTVLIKFNLDERDGRIWKQLLLRKSMEFGIEEVYKEIETLSNRIKFVSLHTFENTYCNPRNETIIPLEKKVFKAICQYLDLPLIYRAALQRERNLTGKRSQEFNSKLKELTKVIIECEVLDKLTNDDELLKTLNESIEVIEKRIDMDFFGFTRDALEFACFVLCHEIIDKMKLKPIHKIEHINI